MRALLVVSGCGNKNTVARHPIGATYERNASRIDRIELIVDDPKRAAQVRRCYVEIERLLANFSKELTELKQALARKKWDDTATDEQVKELFANHDERRQRLQKRYVELQLEIRKFTTEDEFRKIDKLR